MPHASLAPAVILAILTFTWITLIITLTFTQMPYKQVMYFLIISHSPPNSTALYLHVLMVGVYRLSHSIPSKFRCSGALTSLTYLGASNLSPLEGFPRFLNWKLNLYTVAPAAALHGTLGRVAS